MLMLIYILVFCAISFNNVCSSEDKSIFGNVENLKILRNSVNFAFKMTNEFLTLIRGNLPFVYKITDTSFQISKLIPLAGFITLNILGILFVIIVPVVGFFFCCCRCCRKCGGKVKGMDPKYARCKRYTYAFIMGIISVIMLAGVVLAFINNKLLHDTLTNENEEINAIKQSYRSHKNMRISLNKISDEILDAEKIFEISNNEIEKLNFNSVIIKQFFLFLKNESFNSNIKEKIQKIFSKLLEATYYLQKVKRPNKLLELYNKNLMEKSSHLQVDVMENKVKNLLSVFNSDFKELQNLMKNRHKSVISTGKILRKIVTFYKNILDNIDNRLDYLKSMKIEFLEVPMYIFIGVCCLLLLIVMFYFLGLCFGQCGERPFEDARICNRGTGANLMMAGVAFAFIFTPAIMFLTILMFSFGGIFQTDFCRYLTGSSQPRNELFNSIINQYALEVNSSYRGEFINFNAILNRCPSMQMALAFNVNTKFLSAEINEKMSYISDNVKNAEKEDILYSYFGDIVSNLTELEKEIKKSLQLYENFDPETSAILKDKFSSVLSEINSLSLKSYENKIKSFFNSMVINGFRYVLSNEVEDVFNKVYIHSYDNVKCVGMYNATKLFFDAICITFLMPFNGFWSGIGICLVLTIPAIIFSVKLSGLYRHTEKYSTEYLEPNYNSYMGFYTNNADNIPMKKQKSEKFNSKGRNSSLEKNSMTKTNPQYLPVYPYDAYE